MGSWQKVIVKDKKGNRIVKFIWNEQQVLIQTPEKLWQSKDSIALIERPTKIYQTPANTPLIETNVKGLDILAKTISPPFSQWRLRFVGDTMQVFKANQHPPAYWVVQYKLNKYRVYQAGNEVGKTKITNGIVDVDGVGIDLKIPTPTNSYAYTLLMMYQIPKIIRCSLMAELLLKQL
ncbi:toxin protein, putative [Microscilla marina ATCC 23134]|uniref:Toxin protein, putative n=1 Tax=Microscilla marina ATCC 23134 TaxID=313606 RepID=A1ZHN7_MICM2|nr:toxin protein, putative [Microscilla marina ATCC 23134]